MSWGRTFTLAWVRQCVQSAEGSKQEVRYVAEICIWRIQRTCDPGFERFGKGPECEAKKAAHDPSVPEDQRFDGGIEIAVEIHLTFVAEPKSGRPHLHIAGMDDAVGNIEGARTRADPTGTESGRDAIENWREDAEDGNIPEKAIFHDGISIAIPGSVILCAGRGDHQLAMQSSLHVIGAPSEIGDKGFEFGVGGLAVEAEIGVVLTTPWIDYKMSAPARFAAIEIGRHI